jgi:hypothetical protein
MAVLMALLHWKLCWCFPFALLLRPLQWLLYRRWFSVHCQTVHDQACDWWLCADHTAASCCSIPAAARSVLLLLQCGYRLAYPLRQ